MGMREASNTRRARLAARERVSAIKMAFLGIVDAEPGRALDAAMLLSGVAGFGIGLAANAQFPGIGADLSIAGETDGAIG
jgi:hypothetical protein